VKVHFIFPKWPKLEGQNPFDLPPLGPIQAAACLPVGVEASFTNENVAPVDFDQPCDLVGLSVLLACQIPRTVELADAFRSRGKKVVLGGIQPTIAPEMAKGHADSVVVGEAEGLLAKLITDLEHGRLAPRYDRRDLPAPEEIPVPRRDLHDKARHYTYRGWELVDLIQTSRGCRFNCYPCSENRLKHGIHRILPHERVIEDIDRCSRRLYITDDSLEQDKEYTRRLIGSLKGKGKRIVSHSLPPDPEILTLAREAGWWYVYLAVLRPSENLRRRAKMYHEHGIKVQGTIMLGLDEHSEEDALGLVDFSKEIGLDLAEFTVLTPFPYCRAGDQMEAEGRILTRDWSKYNAGNVVFQPKQMSPERLQEIYHEAWSSYYRDEPQALHMSRLLMDAAGS